VTRGCITCWSESALRGRPVACAWCRAAARGEDYVPARILRYRAARPQRARRVRLPLRS
jgi:hypothetical protein